MQAGLSQFRRAKNDHLNSTIELLWPWPMQCSYEELHMGTGTGSSAFCRYDEHGVCHGRVGLSHAVHREPPRPVFFIILQNADALQQNRFYHAIQADEQQQADKTPFRVLRLAVRHKLHTGFHQPNRDDRGDGRQLRGERDTYTL
jgi:hypothetical protein